MSKELTKEEIALYDRQIRLWGMDTQLRMRDFRLLVINVGGVATEAVKNLVLGGLQSIELLDSSVVRSEDYGCQFFLPLDEAACVGQLKVPLILDGIKELNLRVHLTANTNTLKDVLENNPNYFAQFDLVIGTELSKHEMVAVDEICRGHNIPVYFSGLHGVFGYIFTDLITHESINTWDRGSQPRTPGTKLNRVKEFIKVVQKTEDKEELVTVRELFPPISTIFTSKHWPLQLNKRQLKKLTGVLPLIFALAEMDRPSDPESVVHADDLRERALQICRALEVPESIITDEYIDHFTRNAYTEFAPVAAIMGGVLAQDVIQVIGRKTMPINNVLVFDSIKTEMPIYAL